MASTGAAAAEETAAAAANIHSAAPIHARSSLTLEMLLWFHSPFAKAYVLLTLISYATKQTLYPTTESWTVILLILYIISESVRLFLGSKANKTEDFAVMGAFVVLSVLTVWIHVFMAWWQYLVFRMDLVLNIIGIVYYVMEIGLGALAVLAFKV